jgi:hypothetical protein
VHGGGQLSVLGAEGEEGTQQFITAGDLIAFETGAGSYLSFQGCVWESPNRIFVPSIACAALTHAKP